MVSNSLESTAAKVYYTFETGNSVNIKTQNKLLARKILSYSGLCFFKKTCNIALQ